MKARSRGLEDGIGTNSHPEIRQTGAKKAHILNCTGLLNENKPQSHVFSVDRDKKTETEGKWGIRRKETNQVGSGQIPGKRDRDKSQKNAIGKNPRKTLNKRNGISNPQEYAINSRSRYDQSPRKLLKSLYM